MTTRRERRAQTLATRQELRKTLDTLGPESWEIERGPLGFRYWHRDVKGREWTTTGVYPAIAVIMPISAFVFGLVIGIVLGGGYG